MQVKVSSMRVHQTGPAQPAEASIPIICPEDSAPLIAQHPAQYHCTVCHRDYPVEDGVLCLLGQKDEFYEGAYQNHVAFMPRGERLHHVWPLWLINSGYPWVVRRHVPENSLVVELGCAGGVSYFGKRYRMVGCDLSRSSLKKLEKVYAGLLQVDAVSCIALADKSVDAVVSSYFWEHIPPLQKPRILRECARILKPGGKLIFLYDVETNNPVIRHYRAREPMLYRRLFIDGDGHMGYESPTANAEQFRVAGFSIIERRGMEKSFVQSPAAFTKLAEFGGRGPQLFRWAKWLGKKPLFYPYTAVTRVANAVVDPFLPTDWARIELVVCEKAVS